MAGKLESSERVTVGVAGLMVLVAIAFVGVVLEGVAEAEAETTGLLSVPAESVTEGTTSVELGVPSLFSPKVMVCMGNCG